MSKVFSGLAQDTCSEFRKTYESQPGCLDGSGELSFVIKVKLYEGNSCYCSGPASECFGVPGHFK